MIGVSNKTSRLPRKTLLAVLLCVSGMAQSLFSQQATPSAELAREEWFFGQRRYGLGYIPEDALAKAVAQRDSGRSASRTSLAAALATDEPHAITEGRWSSLGPSGINSNLNDLVSGRVNSLAVNPLNPSTVYIAAAGGGVWKSTNRGGRWVPLTDRLPSLASGAVAVDPFSGDVWYGTGELNFCRDCYYGAGVYRSSDGGANWTRVNPGNFLSSPTSLITFDPRNRGTIFIGRSTALWKSTDSGQSWRVVLRGAVTDFALNPADSTVAYAAIGYFSGSPENGIYRTTDGGETWTRLSGGLPELSTVGRVAVAVAPSSPATLYTLIANARDFKLNGLYRSLNGGDTWGRLGGLSQDVLTEDGAGQGAFNLCLEVDPRDAGVVYAGGSDLWKSTDFGSNWANLSLTAGLQEDPHEIVFDPSDWQTFYLVGDSGVWRSSDGGKKFTNLNLTLAITQFQGVGLHPSNPNLAVGGTQDNGTVLYRGGSLWDQGRPGDSGAAFFDAANPQTIYTVSRYLSVRRSDDGGKTFHLIAEGLDPSDRVQFYPPFLPDPNQPEVLYLGTHRLWQSRDRGDHWSPLSGDLTGGASETISALAVAPSSSLVIYAGTSDSLVRVSQDGGLAWRPTAAIPNRFVTSVAVDPRAPQRAVIGVSGFGSGHVFRTEDFGNSWEDWSRNLPDIPVNVVLLDAASPDTIYVGTDIGVFVLGADGSWLPMQDGMPNAIVLGLSQNAATGLLAAATHGRGIFAIATGVPAITAPRLDLVANSASFEAVPLAPGMVASLFGANLASSTDVSGAPPLPTTLAEMTLFVNDIPVPLFFVSSGQINFQVPFGFTGPLVELRLRNLRGEAAMHVPWRDASPGIYQNNGVGIIVHGTGAPVTESSPARRGEELVLFASGLGAVDRAVSSGAAAPFSPLARTPGLPLVRVGGVATETRFSGMSPGFVGLYQVNFVVPDSVSGTTTMSLEIEGVTSNVVLTTVLP
ncbi:MAG: hypothetical protein HY316_06295 [Acidobacteria bacterium]|nr:hypothetical protein [Acidobacteriota bacterium]